MSGDAEVAEADFFEAIREAVSKQRVSEIDLAGFEAALREAMDAAAFAGEQAQKIPRANSFEAAARQALAAIKESESAAAQIKALKKILLDAERTLGSNDDALGVVLGRALLGREMKVADDFHALCPVDGAWKMKVYSPDDVPWSYQIRVPDEDRLRKDLLARKPEDAVGVFEDPSITGARLVQGEPGVKIALKRKQRRATG